MKPVDALGFCSPFLPWRTIFQFLVGCTLYIIKSYQERRGSTEKQRMLMIRRFVLQQSEPKLFPAAFDLFFWKQLNYTEEMTFHRFKSAFFQFLKTGKNLCTVNSSTKDSQKATHVVLLGGQKKESKRGPIVAVIEETSLTYAKWARENSSRCSAKAW